MLHVCSSIQAACVLVLGRAFYDWDLEFAASVFSPKIYLPLLLLGGEQALPMVAM